MPCLWFSGGSDSMLLLLVMLEFEKPFGILKFEDGWSKEQRRAVDAVVMKHNLQAFSYPATDHLLAGNAKELSLASLYAVDGSGHKAMLVRDLVDDPNRCAVDLKLEKPKQRVAPIEYAVHVWGSWKDDRHWIRGEMPLAEPIWFVGNHTFIAPLYEWTREDVSRELKSRNVEPIGIDTGNITACHNCLKGEKQVFCPKTGDLIDSVIWDRKGNLTHIERFLGAGA